MFFFLIYNYLQMFSLFWPKKYIILKPKLAFFSLLCLLTFKCGRYNVQKLHFCTCFAHGNLKKTTWKVGYFSKISEILSLTKMARTAQMHMKTHMLFQCFLYFDWNAVKLGDKKWFDKEQTGVKEPFPVTNLPVYFIRIRNIWH